MNLISDENIKLKKELKCEKIPKKLTIKQSLFNIKSEIKSKIKLLTSVTSKIKQRININ